MTRLSVSKIDFDFYHYCVKSVMGIPTYAKELAAIFTLFIMSPVNAALPPVGWTKVWDGPVGQVLWNTGHMYVTRGNYTNPTGDIYEYNIEQDSWTKIGGPGKIFEVSEDKLYGISPTGGNVYEYTGTPMQWTYIGNDAKWLYRRQKGVYVTSISTGDIIQYNENIGWQRIGSPGKMFSSCFPCSAAPLYGITPDGRELYRWEKFDDNQPGKWTKFGGSAGKIYAYPIGVYATNPTTNDIWNRSTTLYKTASGGASVSDTGWNKIGGPAKAIAVDSVGNLYAITPDGQHVNRFSVSLKTWRPVGDAAGKIFAPEVPTSIFQACATNPTTGALWCWRKDF